jgi:hypothetical protein
VLICRPEGSSPLLSACLQACIQRIAQHVWGHRASLVIRHDILCDHAGSHILNACILDSAPLNELFPQPNNDPDVEYEWKSNGAPVSVKVGKQRQSLLFKHRRLWLPKSKHLRASGHYVVSEKCGKLA